MEFNRAKWAPVAKTVSRRVLVGFLVGFAAVVLAIAIILSNSPGPATEGSAESAPAMANLPALSDEILGRMHYRDSLAADARQLQADIQYSLQGADSSELITTFGASVDEEVAQDYLGGASRRGYPLDDAVMRRLGFKVARAVSSYGALWERKVGGRVKYVARTDSAVAASVASIERVETASVSDGSHFNASVPLFVSKDAMKVALRMINQGITDPESLAPYTVCSAQQGDSFILLDGSWTVSKVMLTSGANARCQGWTANEFTSKK